MYNDITDLDQTTAWVVGVLEGEGCFTPHVSKGKKCGPDGYTMARIQVQMVDKDVVEKLADYFGAKVNGPYTRRQSQPIYHVSLRGKRAKAWLLKHVYFFSERRRKQILEALNVAR